MRRRPKAHPGWRTAQEFRALGCGLQERWLHGIRSLTVNLVKMRIIGKRKNKATGWKPRHLPGALSFHLCLNTAFLCYFFERDKVTQNISW